MKRLCRWLLLLAALGAGSYGLGRSLWLDEAWVANSAIAPSLGAMFFHTHWLQVNPPLFLILVRAAVHAFGLSNDSLRLVPLLLGVAAAACMLASAWRTLSPGFALLAGALLAFHPNMIEYSRTLKPYSGEAASAAALMFTAILYAQKPDRLRLTVLLGVLLVTIPLAYPVVFLVPGVVLLVWFFGGWRVAAAAGVASSAEFLAVYAIFVRPNFSPALREFFKSSADAGITPGVAIGLVFVIAASVRVLLAFKRGDRGPGEWTQVFCLLPCLMLAVTGILGWYPNSHRTRLFVLPGFILVAAIAAEDLLRRWKHRAETAALCVALAIPVYAMVKQVTEHRNRPEEDMAAAVRFLERHVAPEDVVLIHPSVREGMLLYSAMDHWNAPHTLWADTGWPCCQRGVDPKPGGSTREAVTADLESIVPRDFTGRMWLYYTTRPTHWSYVGMNEQNVWRAWFQHRGCQVGPYIAFENQAIRLIECPELGSQSALY